MPQLLAAEVFYAFASAGVSVSAAGAAAITVGSYVVVAAASYGLSMALAPKMPTFGSLENNTSAKLQLSRETTPARRVIYGTQRVSGPIAYVGTSGNKNSEIDIIILLAGHECAGGGTQAHHGIYLNDVLAINEDGSVNTPFSSDNISGLIKVGAQSQSPYAIQTPEWQTGIADRHLNGICALHMHMIHDPQMFPSGLPNISVVIDGKKCLDPRDLNAAASFTDNPASILYDYLTTEFGATTDEIDATSFANAANICDEVVTGSSAEYDTKRYTCNMTFQTSEKPQSIIENILKSCYGKLLYNGKFHLKVGAFSQPEVTLNEADLCGGITIATKAPSSQAYNKVTGIYVDGPNYTSSFQSAEFLPVSSSFYLEEDNGVESVMNLEFPTTTNQRIARRLAKLAMLDNRQDLVINCPCKISGMQLVPGDTFYIQNVRMGWTGSGKLFEASEVVINPDLTVSISAKETSNSIYAWAESEQDVDRDLSPNTSLQDPFIVDAITNFSASNQVSRDRDGTIYPAIQLDWTSPGSASISQIELDFKEDIEPNYIALARLGAGTTTYTTIDVEAGKVYDVRCRQYNHFGIYSPYATASILCVGDNTIPQAPTGSIAVGTGSFALSWTYPSAQESDYKNTKIVINGVSQGFVAGTTYTKQLSGGGAVTCSLQDFDTSGNGSATSSLLYGVVYPLASLVSGSAGPSGSAGDIQQSRYVVYDVTPTVNNVYDPNPTGTAGTWLTYVPNANGSAVWIITATTSADGLTVRAPGWSSPTRFSGNVTWYLPDATPPGGPIAGDWWFKTTSRRWYRYSGSSWVEAESLIALPDFPSTFKPVAIGNTLPGLPDSSYPIGSTFCTTGDGVLYRNNADTWTAAVSTASLVGQITSTQIGDNSISTAKIQANSITGNQIAANSITSSQIVANSITTGLIAAGALTASHVGTNTLIANQANIADAIITSAKIVDLSAGKITAGTITAAVTMSAAYINGGKIDGGGLTVYSAIGIRAKDNSSVLTITGGDDNGSSNGAQIDLTGNNSSGQGALIFQAGQGNLSSVRFLTNQSPTTDIGVLRGEFDTYGLFRVAKNLSNGAVYTQDAGNVKIEGNLALGSKTALNTNSGTGQIDTSGDINTDGDVTAANYYSPSSKRLKTAITPLTGSLTIVNKLSPSGFTWKHDKKADYGLIAEEVNKVLPHLVAKNSDGEIQGLDYSAIVPFLIGAIQELDKKVKRLEKK